VLLLWAKQCEFSSRSATHGVIGLKPWEEFSVNKGRLGPKGVKRYLQSGASDRCLNPLMRSDEGMSQGRLWTRRSTSRPGACARLGAPGQGTPWPCLAVRRSRTRSRILLGKLERVAS